MILTEEIEVREFTDWSNYKRDSVRADISWAPGWSHFDANYLKPKILISIVHYHVFSVFFHYVLTHIFALFGLFFLFLFHFFFSVKVNFFSGSFLIYKLKHGGGIARWTVKTILTVFRCQDASADVCSLEIRRSKTSTWSPEGSVLGSFPRGN